MAAEIRENYLESLQELTASSRPIIKTLTELAQENQSYVPAVVDAIETHIRECPVAHKLPALYLVDSISKNNGAVFRSAFEETIVPIFTSAFEASPESTRHKLNELFKSWTIPLASTNQPVFHHEVLRELNEFMARIQPLSGVSVPAQPTVSVRPRLTQSSLMVEMNRLRTLLEQDQHDNFNDVQQSTLARIEAQISGVCDPKTLPTVLAQLEDMKVARESHLARQASNPRRSHQTKNHTNTNNNNNNNNNNNGRRDFRQQRGNDRHDRTDRSDRSNGRDRENRTNGGVDKITGSNNVPIGTRRRSPVPVPSNDMDLALAADLAHKLARGGAPPINFAEFANPAAAVAAAMTANAMGATVAEVAQAAAAAGASGVFPPPASGASQQSSTAEIDLPNISLADACSTDAEPAQIELLYTAGLPLRCSTCGFRFRDTEEGRAAKQAEMDWHFRANKDIREGHSRTRCWFLTRPAWIEYHDEDEVFGQGANAIDDADRAADGSGQQPIDLEKEREKYIEVPMNSGAVCPVCQEAHAVSWSEEAENWVWMNAVDIDGHYFHATCYADPQNQELVASVLEQKS